MKGGGFIAIIVVILFLALIGSAGGSHETQYDRDFKSGMEKYYSGEKMTKGEYNAVKNYQTWKHNNTEHTYSDWDD